jgi:hypothetical protein
MRRAAWINQVLAAWLIGFVVFGLDDSVSATEVASHGVAALFLLLASWRVLTERVGTTGPSIIQTLSGIWLCLTPFMFQYPTQSFIAMNDFVIGSVIVVDGLIEIWASARSVARRILPPADHRSIIDGLH